MQTEMHTPNATRIVFGCPLHLLTGMNYGTTIFRGTINREVRFRRLGTCDVVEAIPGRLGLPFLVGSSLKQYTSDFGTTS